MKDLKDKVVKLLEEKLDDIFVELHDILDINSGETSAKEEIYLEEAKLYLVNAIETILEAQAERDIEEMYRQCYQLMDAIMRKSGNDFPSVLVEIYKEHERSIIAK